MWIVTCQVIENVSIVLQETFDTAGVRVALELAKLPMAIRSLVVLHWNSINVHTKGLS